ncbi:MAG TPA: hypothetical protein VGB85_27940 [Nannocystis sp.]|jgi:hypothetical protein
MDPKQHLRARIARNLQRVRGLIAASTRLAAMDGPVSEEPADILRAAVVLLHATMEDVLRTLEEVALEPASPATLKAFGIEYGRKKPEKLALWELAEKYGGASISDVVRLATVVYLDGQTYNNGDELAGVLGRLKIVPKPLLDRFAGDLEGMMRRRHRIVHRTDLSGSRVGDSLSLLTETLHPDEVLSWIETVDQFVHAVLERYARSAA